MANGLLSYNLTLNSSSPAFLYLPYRDGSYNDSGDPSGGWRSAYSGVSSPYPEYGIFNVGKGTSYRETYLNYANLTLDFTGTAIYLCLSTASGSTSYNLEIDGVGVTTTSATEEDPACAGTGAEEVAYASGLNHTSHTAFLEVFATSTSPDFLFFGGVVTVDLQGTGPQVVEIGADDPGWTYNGEGWFASVPFDPTEPNANVTCAYGSSNWARYTFSGKSSSSSVQLLVNNIILRPGATAVELLGMANLNIGPFTVTLDNTTFIGNSSDFWRQSDVILFFAGDLDPTLNHTITCINYDPAAPNALQPIGDDYKPCTSINGLRLVQTTPLPSSAPSPSSSSTAGSSTSRPSTPVGAIVGAVIGGIAAVVVFAVCVLFVLRRRRRRGPSTDKVDLDPMEPNTIGPRLTPRPYPLHTPGSVPLGAASTSWREQKAVHAQPSLHPVTTGPSAVPSSGYSGTDPPGVASHSGVLPGSSYGAPTATRVQEPPPVPTRDITHTSTAELVQLLNSRLRAEFHQEDDETEPPEYDDED